VGRVDRLDAQTIALVVGISGAIDFALFYASGQVMDRFGRLWAALPAMVLMGSGFLALAFTTSRRRRCGSRCSPRFWASAMGSPAASCSLGADVAPQDDPAAFLGSWRTLTDAGGAIAPCSSLPSPRWSPLGRHRRHRRDRPRGAAGFIRWVPRFRAAHAVVRADHACGRMTG
jgi:hypothetical protein